MEQKIEASHSNKRLENSGLAGILAGESAICLCGAEDESLLYRGYTIEELFEQSCFEEVAYLLLYEKLPTAKELSLWQKELEQSRFLPLVLLEMVEKIPSNSHPMDFLRSATSLLGNLEPEGDLANHHEALKSSKRLMAALPAMLLYWWSFHQKGMRLQLDGIEGNQACYFLQLLHDHPVDEEYCSALDSAFILYAEHEFNASTFTVRTVASTLSDYFSAICAGIGALRGSLHGGANEKALDLILSMQDPSDATKKLHQRFKHKELVMGFGHRVYKKGDPRSPLAKKWAKRLCEKTGHQNLFAIAERIEQVMKEEKGLCTNLDFYSSLLFYCLRIPKELFTPLFVLSRVTGWSAHLMEQRANNKLIRPLSRYSGPAKRPYLPIDKRP